MFSPKEIVNLVPRVTLTAYCFAQFAVQVLWLSKWQMPSVMKQGSDKVAQRRKALLVAHRHVVAYLKTLSFLGLVNFRSEGKPSDRPCVVVANHPSLLDFIYFLKDFPNAVCLYKSRSLDNPVLSAFIQIAGYIEGMDGTPGASKRIVASISERLDDGHQVVLFPEGTRSLDAISVRKFRTTGFHAALKSNVPVQPVAIYCDPLFLGKDQPWSAFCLKQNTMIVRYLPPINLVDLPEDKQNAAGLSEAAKTQIHATLQEMAATSKRFPDGQRAKNVTNCL